mgnify:CR=1 FL=1
MSRDLIERLRERAEIKWRPYEPDSKLSALLTEAADRLQAVEEQGSSSAAEQVARASTLPLGQAQHSAGQGETGWLIERENRDGLMYRMPTRWDPDAAKGLRFARRADATAFAAVYAQDFTRIAEHRWG